MIIKIDKNISNSDKTFLTFHRKPTSNVFIIETLETSNKENIMKRFKFNLLLAVVVLAAMSSFNCSSTEETQVSKRSDAPEWVLKGSGAFNEKGILYGVGTSSVSDMSAARMQAGERAKADIASQIKVKVKSLSKNYTVSKSGDNGQTTDTFSNVIETLVNQNISGVSVVEYFNDPDSKVLYALAKLDIDRVKSVIDQQNQYDDATKKNLKNSMDDMFNELDRKTRD